jgi:hypothetical protein
MLGFAVLTPTYDPVGFSSVTSVPSVANSLSLLDQSCPIRVSRSVTGSPQVVPVQT